jgi:hypothetical protein
MVAGPGIESKDPTAGRECDSRDGSAPFDSATHLSTEMRASCILMETPLLSSCFAASFWQLLITIECAGVLSSKR